MLTLPDFEGSHSSKMLLPQLFDVFYVFRGAYNEISKRTVFIAPSILLPDSSFRVFCQFKHVVVKFVMTQVPFSDLMAEKLFRRLNG